MRWRKKSAGVNQQTKDCTNTNSKDSTKPPLKGSSKDSFSPHFFKSHLIRRQRKLEKNDTRLSRDRSDAATTTSFDLKKLSFDNSTVTVLHKNTKKCSFDCSTVTVKHKNTGRIGEIDRYDLAKKSCQISSKPKQLHSSNSSLSDQYVSTFESKNGAFSPGRASSTNLLLQDDDDDNDDGVTSAMNSCSSENSQSDCDVETIVSQPKDVIVHETKYENDYLESIEISTPKINDATVATTNASEQCEEKVVNENNLNPSLETSDEGLEGSLETLEKGNQNKSIETPMKETNSIKLKSPKIAMKKNVGSEFRHNKEREWQGSKTKREEVSDARMKNHEHPADPTRTISLMNNKETNKCTLDSDYPLLIRGKVVNWNVIKSDGYSSTLCSNLDSNELCRGEVVHSVDHKNLPDIREEHEMNPDQKGNSNFELKLDIKNSYEVFNERNNPAVSSKYNDISSLTMETIDNPLINIYDDDFDDVSSLTMENVEPTQNSQMKHKTFISMGNTSKVEIFYLENSSKFKSRIHSGIGGVEVGKRSPNPLKEVKLTRMSSNSPRKKSKSKESIYQFG